MYWLYFVLFSVCQETYGWFNKLVLLVVVLLSFKRFSDNPSWSDLFTELKFFINISVSSSLLLLKVSILFVYFFLYACLLFKISILGY